MSCELQPLVGRVAGLISLLAFLPYILAIVQGTARPNYATWLIWTVVGGLLFASYDAGVGGAARWVPLSDALGPAIIAVLSLRYREGAWTRFDLGCLTLAGLSVIGWVWTGSAMVALGINLCIDLLGALPTLRSVYRNPASESALTWRLFFLGNALNLVAIEDWSLSSASYPVYVVLISGLVNVLLSVPARGQALSSWAVTQSGQLLH